MEEHNLFLTIWHSELEASLSILPSLPKLTSTSMSMSKIMETLITLVYIHKMYFLNLHGILN